MCARPTINRMISRPLALLADARDERPIDLQRVDGELLQVAQRAIAGAEVVQAHAHAERAQLVRTDRTRSASAIATLSVISSRSPGGGKPAARAARRSPRHQRVGSKPLADRFTLTVTSATSRSSPPLLALAARLAERPLVDARDDTEFLGDVQERRRLQQAPLGMLPADQGLDAHHPPVAKRDDGLIPQTELVPLDGAPQVRFRAAAAPALPGASRRQTSRSDRRRRSWRDTSPGRRRG